MWDSLQTKAGTAGQASAGVPLRSRFVRLATVGGLLVVAIGCGQPPDEVYDIESWQGSIDETASPAVQAKQDALIRLFTAVQEVGIENVRQDHPDLRFGESFEEFFEEAVDLHRWDWDGPPQGDAFPVLLVLSKDEPGLPQVEKHRTYLVRKSGRSFTIRRAADK